MSAIYFAACPRTSGNAPSQVVKVFEKEVSKKQAHGAAGDRGHEHVEGAEAHSQVPDGSRLKNAGLPRKPAFHLRTGTFSLCS